MARVSSGHILKGASGRIGNLVTYDLRGTQVVKTLPEGKKKTSDLQQDHLYSFKAQHRLAKSVKKWLIDRIWIHFPMSGGLNPYNYFIKCNRQAFGDQTKIIFPELMVISLGNLVPAPEFKASRRDNELVFTWNKTALTFNASPVDRLNIVLLKDRNELVKMETNALREQGEETIVFTNTSAITEGFAFWSSGNDTLFSPSIYWVS